MGQEGADEFGRLGQRPPEQAQESHPAALLVAGHAQQGAEETIDDLRRLQRLAGRLALHRVEDAHALIVEPVQPAPEDLLHQRLRGAEVVIHRCQIDPGFAGDLAHRGALVAMRHEQALGRIEYAFAGIASTCFDHDCFSYDSYVRFNHRKKIGVWQAFSEIG